MRKREALMEFILIGLGAYLDILAFNGVAIAVSSLTLAVVAMMLKRLDK